MKRTALMSLAIGIISLLNSTLAVGAIATFFGEDVNNSAITPLASFPNSSAARTNFLSGLIGVGTETFESETTGAGVPLAISFPGAGTATLTGGNGQVSTNLQGSTNGAGRYGVTNDGLNGSVEKFWEVTAGGAGNFVVNFSQAVAAFGFFGIDVGDFGGRIQLQTVGGANVLLDVPAVTTVGNGGSTDGSVLFFGFTASTLAETFTSVSFLTSTGGGDIFAFDNFTVGSIEQVQAAVPEPMSMLVWLGLIGSTALFARRKLKQRDN